MTQEQKELLLKDLCAINSERWLSLNDLPNEEWKPITGYDNKYAVSNHGRVRVNAFAFSIYGKRKHKQSHILKTIIRKDGYCKVCLGGYKNQKTFNLHRLVATAFVPNPYGLPIVNHKDENPTNNKADNLEWCTYRYNNNYGTFQARRSLTMRNYPKFSKPVIQMTLDGEFLKEYPSIAEAARQIGGTYENISEYLNNNRNRKHAYGYKWRFKEDNS